MPNEYPLRYAAARLDGRLGGDHRLGQQQGLGRHRRAGLRLGEAAALQFGDVDHANGRLQVRRQVQRAGKGCVEIRLPKYGSERTVPMAPELAAILRAHEAMGHLSQWLFAGGEELPPHQNTVGHQWRVTLRRAGLAPIRLHDLRHFYASGLIAEGCDVVTVQRALGHAKASTTLDTYAKLWPSGEDPARRAASGLAGLVLPAPADAPRGKNPRQMWAGCGQSARDGRRNVL